MKEMKEEEWGETSLLTLRLDMCLNTNGLDIAICRLMFSFMAPM